MKRFIKMKHPPNSTFVILPQVFITTVGMHKGGLFTVVNVDTRSSENKITNIGFIWVKKI